MNKKYNVKTSSLTKILQIGQKPDPGETVCSGSSDEQLNFYPNDIEYNYRLFPWEWVLIPKIIECAKKLEVEVPECY